MYHVHLCITNINPCMLQTCAKVTNRSGSMCFCFFSLMNLQDKNFTYELEQVAKTFVQARISSSMVDINFWQYTRYMVE